MRQQTQSRRIAVIGAGVVGVATALTLARAGADVVLIDRAGPAAGASAGNAGLLAAAAVLPNTAPGLIAALPRLLLSRNQPLYLRWPYLPRLAPWALRYLRLANAADTRRLAAALVPLVQGTVEEHRALSAGTAAARYLHDCDYVYAYADRAGFDGDRFGWDLRRAHGVMWEEMDVATLAAYDPLLASGGNRFAIRMPGHGRVSDPAAYVTALAEAAAAAGAQLIRADVTGIAQEAGRVTGLRAGGEVIGCDRLVLTSGAWSGPLARQLGLRVPLETERGYHIELWAPSAMPRAPTMIAAGQFVATPMEGRLRLAGVVEMGGLDAPPSAAPLAMMRRLLARSFPGLTWARQTDWMGHRPSTPDSLPVIGAVPGLAGAFVGFGHQHVGLTAGAVTGRWLAQMALGARVNADLSAYAPGRFG